MTLEPLAHALPRRWSRHRLPCAWLVLVLAGCLPGSQLPDVSESGQWVEFATNAGRVTHCGGTVARLDGFANDLASELGGQLPDEPFITYYWLPADLEELSPCREDPDVVSNCARRRGDRSLVFAATPTHFHEVVHAVHLEVWPGGATFLREGLAQVFGEQGLDRRRLDPQDDIDAILVGEGERYEFYVVSWHLVYWMIKRHGMIKLREFWDATEALGEGASASDVRDAFQGVFGESLDAQIEETADLPSCTIPLCGGTPIEWDGDVWSATGPARCDDENAIGPSADNETPLAWSRVLMDLDDGGPLTLSLTAVDEDDEVELRRCDDLCDGASDSIRLHSGSPDRVEDMLPGRWAIRIVNRHGTPPATLTITRP